MSRKLIVCSLIFSFIIHGCIEPYHPDEDTLKTGTMVVVAYLNDIPGEQSVYLSRSASLTYPKYDPVTGCFVEVVTAHGDAREFRETGKGKYTALLDENFLKTGEQYRLRFITSAGHHYESELETLYPAPAIDSIYYTIERIETEDPGQFAEGIRFYVDFEIEHDSSRYLRWEITETFEFHNPNHRGFIYDKDRLLKELPDSSSWRTCWITFDIQEIFTLDIGNFTGEIYVKFPLNFVSNEPQRLHHGYSLLVRQLSLGANAFWYWNELAKNVQTRGGLFDRQPAITPGNICNPDDEDELIIGYFSVSGAVEKRVFVDEVPGLELITNPWYCFPGEYPRLRYIHTSALPVYLARAFKDGEYFTGETEKQCLDCREYEGSSHIKPDFWKE